MKQIWKLYQKYQEIVDYLFWGVMSTIVSWGTYAVFSRLFSNMQNAKANLAGFSFPLDVFWANVLSWCCAMVFAFVVNKLFVFRSKSWDAKIAWPEFVKFFMARAITGLLEIVGVPLAVAAGLNQTIFGVEGMLAKVIVSVIVVILNYVFSKLFIFKGNQKLEK